MAMTITSEREGSAMRLTLAGRLDTVTAQELEAELFSLDNVETLTLDCAGLEYISSAGLRVLFSAHKRMAQQGRMVLTNVGDEIADVFSLTGYSEFLNIE